MNYASIVPDSLASEVDESNLARRLASLLSIADDFRRILDIAERIEKLLTDDSEFDRLTLESLTWHLVLRYSRCFDSTATGRTTVLGEDAVRGLADPALSSFHEGLLHRRHNTFAHAGGDCSCRLNVHLIDLPDGPQLRVTLDEEAPGPINDPDHVKSIQKLCVALLNVVAHKIEKASTAYANMLDKDHEAIVQRLRSNAGKHANLSQQAIALLAQMKRE